MNETEPTAPAAAMERSPHSARSLVRLNLAVLGGGFAWFAYIDAPITDGAMRIFAASVLAGLASIIAALISSESRSVRVIARTRRVALWMFGVATALMLITATVTLNLKGSGNDDSDTQTAVIMRV